MKKTFLLLLLLSSCEAFADFSGQWANDDSASSNYLMDLIETGDHISGRYCFVTNNGNRIDCTEQDDGNNITGTITNGKAYISFDSTFGGRGTAVLTLKDDNLICHFEDKTPFIEANMSVPDQIVMQKNLSQ